MENQVNETNESKRKELTAEYNSSMEKSEERLDELHVKKQSIDECCDEINYFWTSTKQKLSEHQSELAQVDSYEDFELFQRFEEELDSNCRMAENVLLDEQDEIELERKKIFRVREDIESEYRYAMLALNEG